MLFLMFIQARPGTQELPTPRAKDGIPQPSTTSLTVTPARHKYSKLSLTFGIRKFHAGNLEMSACNCRAASPFKKPAIRGRSYKSANNSLAISAPALYDESCNRAEAFLTCESKQDSISEVVGRLDEGQPATGGAPVGEYAGVVEYLGVFRHGGFFCFQVVPANGRHRAIST
jgi:hypothetical protein